MRVLIVVPWRPDGEDRIAIWRRLKPHWESFGYPIVEADSGDEPFNRGHSQNLGAESQPWDVLAVVDADVVVRREAFEEGIQLAHQTGGVVLPHTVFVSLDAEQTQDWLAQDDLERAPSGALHHRGGAVGGVHLLSRRAWDIVQYDGETRHRGQDRRLLTAAKAAGIPVERIPGPLIHGDHVRPDMQEEWRTTEERIRAFDPLARPNSPRWLRAAREVQKQLTNPTVAEKALVHFVMIRSAYDDPRMSRVRLDISSETVIPALQSQTDKEFELIVKLHRRDPLRLEREDLFLSTGVTTTFIDGQLREPSFRDDTGLGGAWPRGGPLLQTRLDDDDAIVPDFIERLHGARFQPEVQTVLSFPVGYDGPIGEVAPRHYPDSMFLTLYTPPGDMMSVYDTTHNNLWHSARNKHVVDMKPAWVHHRHPDALTSMYPRK